MSRTIRILLVVVLLVLAVAACGKDKNEGKKLSLSETYTSPTGLSVKYPKDWAVKEDNGQISIANSQEALGATDMAAGQFGVVVMLIPAGLVTSPKDALTMFTQSVSTEGTTIGGVTDTKVGGKTAASTTMSDAKTDGKMFAIDLGDGNIIIAAIAAGKGELKNNEATGMDIIASVSYTAPAG
jgi:hypothetical protein